MFKFLGGICFGIVISNFTNVQLKGILKEEKWWWPRFITMWELIFAMIITTFFIGTLISLITRLIYKVTKVSVMLNYLMILSF